MGYLEETNSNSSTSAIVFDLVVTVLMVLVLLIPSVIGYMALWLGEKTGWWVFDMTANEYIREKQ